MEHVAKSLRLGEIKELLLAHPRGLSQAEIARRLGVHRSTIYRNLPDLTVSCAVVETDDGRLMIDRDAYLTHVDFTLHEAMALHLAARLMATRMDRHNPHAASALRKLGRALEKLAPAISRHLVASAEVMDDVGQRQDPVYLDVLETLTRAWSERRQVRVWHQHEETRQVHEYRFAPYFIEPYAIGQTTHVIGWRQPPGELRTFKLERIRRIQKLDEPYEIPADFDPREKLSDAWGIWYTEREPVEVVLKFHEQVAHRVRETRWHRSEQLEPQMDGSLLWRARIAEPQEMLPWIRGWGADVEVLEPKELREKMVEEAQQFAQVYNLGPATVNDTTRGVEAMDVFQKFLTLPGKTEPRLTIFEHSSDVFYVMIYLLAKNAAAVGNTHLAKAGALLHDVGKIEQDIHAGKQWKHQPYSSKYLQSLLDHPRMKALFHDNGIDLTRVKYDDLLLICEHHHDISTQPALLRRCPDALLVSVADVIASSLESGWVGDIKEMLAASPYIDLNASLLTNLGLDGGLDAEVHRIELPGDSVADALLNDLIFRDMSKRLPSDEFTPILQKNNSMWIVGQREALQSFLEGYVVTPQTLYESADLANEIFEGVLAAMPAPGALQADSIKYLLVNEQIARRVALLMSNRKKVRRAMEHFDISLDRVYEAFGVHNQTSLDQKH